MLGRRIPSVLAFLGPSAATAAVLLACSGGTPTGAVRDDGVTAPAAGAHAENPTSAGGPVVSCPQSIAAYCASAQARCSFKFGAYTTGLTALPAALCGNYDYGPSACAGYDAIQVGTTNSHETWLYDHATGDLVAHLGTDANDLDVCLAGPAEIDAHCDSPPAGSPWGMAVSECPLYEADEAGAVD